jgi:hypothetical protein
MVVGFFGIRAGTDTGHLLDTEADAGAKPLKSMALPSEGRVSRRNKGLGRCLGKSASIDLQGVSPGTPKHFSIVQRDDGMWSISWHDDAPGPFESLRFAQAVAARTAVVRQ